MTKISIVMSELGTHGPSLIRAQIAAEMIRRGIKVDVVLGQDSNNLAPRFFGGCETHLMDSRRPRDFIGKLCSYLKKSKPDGLIASSWPYSVASILAAQLYDQSLPIVVSEHADFRTNIERSGEFTTKDAFLIKSFSRFAYNRATRIVGVSQGVIDGMCEVAGVDREKTTTIHNPLRHVQNDIFLDPHAQRARKAFWGPEDTKLLSVGRLAPQKDFKTMIEAMSLLKFKADLKLIIVGSGRLRSELEEYIAHLGLAQNIMLAGESEVLADYYHAADLFLFSSASEGFGNVLVEALSFGLPIVSTDCLSGPSEILDGGAYGILTPVGDPVAFAAGIEQALSVPWDPERQKHRSTAFSVEAATDQYLAALFPN